MADSGKSPASQIAALQDAARDYFITRPLHYLASLRGKLSNLPATNFDMGCEFAERGAMRDAAMRFRIAVKLDPHFVQAWHNLGVCLMQLGDREKASEAFQHTLALRPNHEEARYLLASVNPSRLPRDQWPTRMPRAIVERFFAAAAPYYLQVETQNQYAGPTLCEQKLAPHLSAQTGLHVVDLGCGVGLAATPWRAKAVRIIGVDVVGAMIKAASEAKAGGAPLFDEVISGDLYTSADLAIAAGTIDVALLCNVAQFLGELDTVMQGLAKWLKPNGVAAITVEPTVSNAAFGIHPATGRFGHSAAYLQERAQAHGFSVILQERAHLYPAMDAGIVVLRKGT